VAPPRRSPTSWRPKEPGHVPSLGADIIDWGESIFRNPRNDAEPLRLTDDQRQRVLRFYRLDEHGRRCYRRVHVEDAKGYGKSPLAAFVALAEFAGPVCFDGWGADGEPRGRPWGTGGRPAPWVQVAAVSEDQTANTSNAVYGLLASNGGKVADELRIDVGRTRLYRRDMPMAFFERVTASAGSREGQPLTFAVLDEPQLWTESNGGVRLARTILRNTAKMNGWGLFTGNAPVIGQGSVSELFADPAPDVLHLARRPSETPQQDWPPERLRAALEEVYGDAWWVEPDRLMADIADPAQPWRDSLRFFFNVPIHETSGDTWMDPDEWDACVDDAQLRPAEPAYASIRVGRDHGSAAVAIAQKQGERVVLRCTTFESPDDVVDLGDVEAHVLDLTRRFPARVVAEVVFSPGGKPHRRPRPGPEFSYNGAFFQRSRQLLESQGVVMLEVPDSGARLAPAAAQMRGLVREGKFSHDGDPALAEHVLAVVVKPTQSGDMPQAGGARIEAALASMHAVSRAMTAPSPPSRKVTGLR
jgi:hypothetical protein